MNPTDATRAESSSPLTFADGRRRGGWSWYSNAILNAPISGPAVFTYLVLCRYADGEGASWPSIARLAADQRCSRSRVKMSLSELEKAGLLEVQLRDPHMTSVYVLKTPGHLVTYPRSPHALPPVTTCPTPGHLVTGEVDLLNQTKEEEVGAAAPAAPATPVSAYTERWKSKHGITPLVTGKDAATLARLHRRLGPEDFTAALDRYFALESDRLVAEQHHPVGLLESARR